MKLVSTGSQTVGPFFTIGLSHLSSPQTPVEPGQLTIHGRIVDGNGDPVSDAMLEVWRADPLGRYASTPTDVSGLASGFTRVASDDRGCFSFTTSRPGLVDFNDKQRQAPHLVVLVFARGLLRQLITRMYFPDEPGNGADPVLHSVPADRRKTMIAKRSLVHRDVLKWDIVLQGEDETVFFAW
jgi:protocatechuate 3,4-dioxygenase, alpha subunit